MTPAERAVRAIPRTLIVFVRETCYRPDGGIEVRFRSETPRDVVLQCPTALCGVPVVRVHRGKEIP